MNAATARRLRLLPSVAKRTRKPGTWGPLAEPVDHLDTLARMRAQSILTGIRYRDGSSTPDTLSIDQARDVLAWSQPAK